MIEACARRWSIVVLPHEDGGFCWVLEQGELELSCDTPFATAGEAIRSAMAHAAVLGWTVTGITDHWGRAVSLT